MSKSTCSVCDFEIKYKLKLLHTVTVLNSQGCATREENYSSLLSFLPCLLLISGPNINFRSGVRRKETH